MESYIWGAEAPGAMGATTYISGTSAHTVQGHDPTTASHMRALQVLFNEAKYCCRALTWGHCGAAPLGLTALQLYLQFRAELEHVVPSPGKKKYFLLCPTLT